VSASGHKLVHQLGVLGSGVLLGLAIRFVQSALLARLLGVAEFGQLAAVTALVSILARVNDFGLPGAAAYHLRRQPGSLDSLLRHIGLDFLWCCAAGLVTALLAPALPLPFAADLRHSLWLRVALGVLVAASTPAIVLPGLVTARGDYRSYIRLTNLDAAAQAVLLIGACIAFGSSYQHAVAALAVEQVLASLGFLWFVRRYRGRAPAVRLSAAQTYGYGIRLQLGIIAKLIGARADLLIISAILPVSQVGAYSVASSVRDLGLLPQSVYGAPFMNLVIDRSKQGQMTDRAPVLTALLLHAVLSIGMLVGAVVTLPVLIPLVYGREFGAAVGPAVVLFASVLFLGPAGVCWLAFNAKGRPHFTSWIQTVAGLLSPALTLALVYLGYGLYGSAAAGVLAAAVAFALSIHFLNRLQVYESSDYHEAVRHARDHLRSAARAARTYARGPTKGKGRGTSAPSDAK
jgi:O-antigen/teichoic acid export membrane protein